MQSDRNPLKFWRNMLSPTSPSNIDPSNQTAASKQSCLLTLLGLPSYPEDGGSTFPLNVIELLQDCTTHFPEGICLHSHHSENLKYKYYCYIDRLFYARNTIIQQGQQLFSSTASRPVVGPSKLPIQWVTSVLFSGVKRAGRDVYLHLNCYVLFCTWWYLFWP
jgi:hypothetical protein